MIVSIAGRPGSGKSTVARALAARLGVNAFPFWVITDGDGTVLLRSAGYLDAGQLDDLLQSLDTYDA